MSLMHSIVNLSLKHGKRTYDPQHPADYPAARTTELQQNKFAQAPKSVLITADTVNGVSVEWLTMPENPADKIILYIHGVCRNQGRRRLLSRSYWRLTGSTSLK